MRIMGGRGNMRFSQKGRQSAAWICTMALLISSTFGNTVWARQDEDWVSRGSHSYHDCLIDADCMEEMAMLFEDEDFLEENGWTEEQGQREMLKEMLRIYNLFGKEPLDGWDAYADLADIVIASSSNAEEDSDAAKATASNAEKATASDLTSEFSALKKEVRGEVPEYQEYYCAELMDDSGVELMSLDEDGTSAGIMLETEKRPHIVIKGEKEVYGQIFANACENEHFTLEVQGVDAQGQPMEDQTFTQNPRMWDLQDWNWYNNCGYNRWQVPTDAKHIYLSLSLSEGVVEKGFYFTGTPQMDGDGNLEFQVAQSRGRHISFSYPTAGSFGGTSSDDGMDAVLTFKDFAVFTNELYGTIGHIEGNIAVGKVTGQQVDTATNQNVLNIDGDSSRVTYLKYPDHSLPITATQGSRAEIVLGNGADIWVGTNGHGNKGEWYAKFLSCGYDTLVGSSGQVQYIANEDDIENGGFSIDIQRALNTLAGYHPTDNAEVTVDERSIIVNCEQETTVVTVKAEDLAKEWFKLMDFDESKTLIINVDTEGASDISIRAAIALNGNGQLGDWKALAGNIVWNFGNFHGKVYGNIINSGLLLVPKGEVELYANWNGCIAADRVANPGAEIHKVKPEIDDPDPEPDPTTTTAESTTTTTESTSSTTESTTSTTESTSSTTESTTSTTESTSSTTESTTSTTESTTTTVTESSTETTTESTTSTTTSTTTTSTTTTEATTKPTTTSTTTTEATTKPTTSTTTTAAPTTTKGGTRPTTVTESSTETTSEATTTTRGTTTETASTATTTAATTTTRGGSENGGGHGGSHRGGGNGGNKPAIPLKDNPVPLANMPGETDADPELFLLDDPDVPLAGLPKTGDTAGMKFVLFALSLSALMVQLRKRREEKEHES